eukprot:140450_1
MSDSTYTNQFDWDTHVIKHPVMGHILTLQMNEDQIDIYENYDFNQFQNRSFLTTVSLPFINKQKWTIQTQWNGTETIFKMDAFTVAKQFERQYMAFVYEASKRNYLLLDEFDPTTFICDSIVPVPQIKIASLIRWNDLFGKIHKKISQHQNLYTWNIGIINIYQIQLLNINASIKNKQLIFKEEYSDITADSTAISVYDKCDFLWELSSYLLSTKEIWEKSTSELEAQIIKTIKKHLRKKQVNRKVKENKCFVWMKPTEFEKHIVTKSTTNCLKWTLESKSDNKLSVSLVELKQLFGTTAGIRVVKIKDNNDKIIEWKYFANKFDFRYSYVATKLFISFTPRSKDPDGDVAAT